MDKTETKSKEENGSKEEIIGKNPKIHERLPTMQGTLNLDKTMGRNKLTTMIKSTLPFAPEERDEDFQCSKPVS